MVRLISYNIEYDEGLVGRWYDYLKLWRLFRAPPDMDMKIVEFLKKQKPDIIALIEVDHGSFRSRYRDEARFYEHEMGFENVTEAIKYPFNLIGRLFHSVPILRKQSNALITRYNLYNIKHHLLHHGAKRMVIEATANCPKKPVTFIVAHLALGYGTRQVQLKELAHIIRRITHPVILMGDFNTFNGLHELDYLIKNTHLAFSYGLNKSSLRYTFPAWHPNRRLDYILHSAAIHIIDYKVLKCEFSDHLPVMVDFEFAGRKGSVKKNVSGKKAGRKAVKKAVRKK